MAENFSLLQVSTEHLFLPALESCTVISMQDGSRVSHSELLGVAAGGEVGEEAAGGEVGEVMAGEGEHTWISIKAEPKFPDGVEHENRQLNQHSVTYSTLYTCTSATDITPLG